MIAPIEMAMILSTMTEEEQLAPDSWRKICLKHQEIAKEEEARIQAAENAAENLGDLFNSSGINTLRSNRGYHKTGRKFSGAKDILSMDDIFKI